MQQAKYLVDNAKNNVELSTYNYSNSTGNNREIFTLSTKHTKKYT